jgi:hypothetical protein
MSKTIRNIGVVAAVAVVTVFAISSVLWVRSASAAQTQSASYEAIAHGGRFCGDAGLEAAAQALGLTTDEVTTQMRAGESLADLADEAGVDVQDVLDAVTAACNAATREAIEQAVTDGTLTRDHADWLLEGLDNGYWGGAGGGFGFGGRGGFGGFHVFDRQPGDGGLAPTSVPSGTSSGA